MTYLQRTLQASKWTIWLASLAGLFNLAFHFDKRYQLELDQVLNYRYVVWTMFAYAYVLMMLPLWFTLRKMIYGLADPAEPDADTRSIAGFIAIAIIIGITSIVGLLAADYIGHTEAAERALLEEKWNKEDDTLAAPIAVLQSARTENKSTVPPGSVAAAAPSRVVPTSTKQTADPKKSERAPRTWSEKTGGFLGTFGDFFGGVLNPILTFGTLIALAITVLMQRVQLKEARSEAKRSGVREQTLAFETTFFNMLNLHAENARHLTFDSAYISAADLTKHSLWRRVVRLTVRPPKATAPAQGRAVFAEVLRSTAQDDTQIEPQLEAYRTLQIEHNGVLGHYFRHLYQILDHIDRFKIDGLQVDFNTRKRYSNILRAQLSSHELAVLLLNCVELMVDDGAFNEKIVRYQLLEHLPVYETGDGELRAQGIDPNSEEIFFQYFGVSGEPLPKWTSGAFGNNPAVAAYLEEQQSSSWSKPRPQRTTNEPESAVAEP